MLIILFLIFPKYVKYVKNVKNYNLTNNENSKKLVIKLKEQNHHDFQRAPRDESP